MTVVPLQNLKPPDSTEHCSAPIQLHEEDNDRRPLQSNSMQFQKLHQLWLLRRNCMIIINLSSR